MGNLSKMPTKLWVTLSTLIFIAYENDGEICETRKSVAMRPIKTDYKIYSQPHSDFGNIS